MGRSIAVLRAELFALRVIALSEARVRARPKAAAGQLGELASNLSR